MNSYSNDFPILQQKIGKNNLVYFDNAASTQKPLSVINAVNDYYIKYNSNIHRGAHHLANLATEKYENARNTVANYINSKPEEIIFTKGTTESINLLASTWGRTSLNKGDNIILSEMEHHANIVPWLALQEELGFEIRYIPIKRNTNEVHLDESIVESLFDKNTRLLSIAHVSNAIGTIHNIDQYIYFAKKIGSLVHLDLAQSIQHYKCDVKKLDIDFASFSSHKMYGPMGIGVFYGKKELLINMPPYQKGGEMIKEVFFNKVTYNSTPFRYEAGTPNVVGVIGLGEAIKYINTIGIEKISQIENELHSYFIQKMASINGIILYTPNQSSCSVVSFNVKNIHSFDIGQILDSKGIATRTGHHCCQPLMRKLEIEGTCRASISFYNTKEEVDFFITNLQKAISILS